VSDCVTDCVRVRSDDIRACAIDFECFFSETPWTQTPRKWSQSSLRTNITQDLSLIGCTRKLCTDAGQVSEFIQWRKNNADGSGFVSVNRRVRKLCVSSSARSTCDTVVKKPRITSASTELISRAIDGPGSDITTTVLANDSDSDSTGLCSCYDYIQLFL
jgi:hypothetical protein